MSETMTGFDRLIAIDCSSVADFLQQYYLPDRYHGRGDDYAAALLASAERSFRLHGETIVSRHESILRKAVWYYGTAADAARALFLEVETYRDRAEHCASKQDRQVAKERADRIALQAHELLRLAESDKDKEDAPSGP